MNLRRNPARTCYAERCHVSCLPMPQRQAFFVPLIMILREQPKHLRRLGGLPPNHFTALSKPTSRCFGLPPKPPATGGCAPRSAKRRNCSACLFRFPRFSVVRLRLPSDPRDNLHIPASQILLFQRGMGGDSRHNSPSAAFALRSPASQCYASLPSQALRGAPHKFGSSAVKSISESPANPNGSWFSGRKLPSNHQPPGPFFLREPTAYPAGL